MGVNSGFDGGRRPNGSEYRQFGTPNLALTRQLQALPIAWPDSMAGKGFHLVGRNEIVTDIPDDRVTELMQAIDARSREAYKKLTNSDFFPNKIKAFEVESYPAFGGASDDLKLLVGPKAYPAAMYTARLASIDRHTTDGWRIEIFPYFQSPALTNESGVISLFDAATPEQAQQAIVANRRLIYPVSKPFIAQALDRRPSTIIVPYGDHLRIITPA